MRIITLLVLAVMSCICSYSQILPFKKSFTIQQTKNWITQTLSDVVLWEHNSHSRPTFSFEDTSFIIGGIKSSKTFNGILITLNYVLPVGRVTMENMNLIMSTGSNTGEEFISFERSGDN